MWWQHCTAVKYGLRNAVCVRPCICWGLRQHSQWSGVLNLWNPFDVFHTQLQIYIDIHQILTMILALVKLNQVTQSTHPGSGAQTQQTAWCGVVDAVDWRRWRVRRLLRWQMNNNWLRGRGFDVYRLGKFGLFYSIRFLCGNFAPHRPCI